jgi:hypothetical protein
MYSPIKYLLSQLILIPTIIGWIRWRHLNTTYRYFVLHLTVGYLFESIGYWAFKPLAMNLINFSFELPMQLLYFFFISECIQWRDKNKYRLAYTCVYMLMIFADLIFADLNRYRHSLSMLSFETLNLFFSLMLAKKIFDISFVNHHRKILLMILIPNILTQIILVKNVAFFYFHYEPGWVINFGIISYLLNAVNTVSYIFFSIALLWIPKKEVFLQRIY